MAKSQLKKPKTIAEPNLIPQDLRKIRALSLEVFGKGKGKELMAALKEYYIMNAPVALASYPKSYCYFREGQNSLLRSMETFAAEEKEFTKALANQMQGPDNAARA
jgi:hypothetical protein